MLRNLVDEMKQILFDTKENNNRRREKAFLALSPGERVEVFLKMCSDLSLFSQKNPRYKNKDNFVIHKRREID